MSISLTLGLFPRTVVRASLPEEWTTAQNLLATNTFPDWEPTRALNLVGNSISGSVGASGSLLAATNSLVAVGATNDVDARFEVGGGTNTAETLAYLNTNLSTADRAKDLVVTDPIIGEIITPSGTRRFDFWRTDAVFDDYEAIRDLMTDGAEALLMMVASPDDAWSGNVGVEAGFSHWKGRAQEKAYSADVVDVRQHMIDWYGLQTGFEAVQREWNELPLGLCGNPSAVTLARTNAAITIADPLTLNLNEGDPVTRAVAADFRLYVHQGAFGGGSNLIADTRHPNYPAKLIQGALVRDWDLGRQGFAPFIPAGLRFKTTSDVATGATIGTVRMRGVPDEVTIAFGNSGGGFTIADIGTDANGYGVFNIKRASGGSITEGENKLYITVRKGSYRRTEIVRVMVMAASGARVPTPIEFSAPFAVKAPRAAVTGSYKQCSFLFRGRIDNLSADAFLFSFAQGATTDQFFARITSGRVDVQARNAANGLALRAISRSLPQGGPVVVEGEEFAVFAAFDWETGVVNARIWKEATGWVNLPFTGTGTTFSTINSFVIMDDQTPRLLCNQPPAGFFAGNGAWPGSVTALAFWFGTYHDTAAQAPNIIDSNGDWVLTDPAFTINGVASHPVRLRGPKADLFAGGQDASMTLLPLWRPAIVSDGVA
jgi:hypothetical protein